MTALEPRATPVPSGEPDPPRDGASPAGGVAQSAPLHGTVARALQALPPPVLVLLAIVSIQVGAAFAVGLFPALGPDGTVFLRVLLSALLLGLVWRPRLDRQVRAHAGLLLLFGLTIAGMNLCFYQAIARIPLGVAVTIEFVGPLALAVATSRRLAEFLWIGLAAAGLVLLAPDVGGRLDPLGVAFACGAAVGWAGFVVIAKRAGRLFARGTGLALAMAIAALLLLPFGVGAGRAVAAEPVLLVGVFAVALLSTTIPWSLEFEALKRMPARSYGVLVTLEPATAVVVGILLLGERLTWATVAAVVAVTTAAVGVTLHDRRGKAG
jgi:inner membrane transporter RhtA